MLRLQNSTHKKRVPIMVYRRSLTMTLFTLTLFSLSISFLLSWPLATSFAQLSSPSSSPEIPLTQEGANQLAELEAARQQYLSAWNNTTFSSRFDVFIEEGNHSGYGVYGEHVSANVFTPGETIVLYVEPVGFGHQPITDAGTQDGANSNATDRTLYLMNMTADYIVSDSNGTELATTENVPAINLISHRQNTEFSLTLTLSQEEPFPVGDYIITYVINDEVSGQSFQIDKRITIDDDTTSTAALPLPDNDDDDTSMQQLLPQQQLEERSQALES